jgi:single-strand DNA-binding protein
MSQGLNKMIALGNRGNDPELRMSGGGTAILKLSLAVNETYLDRNQQRQERVEWIRCVVFGRRAEGLGKILSKGDRLLVEGKMRTSSYDDKDGNKRYTTEIVAQNVVLSGSARGGNGGGRSGESDNSGGGGGGYDDADYGGPGIEDEIPFIAPFDVKRRHVDRI